MVASSKRRNFVLSFVIVLLYAHVLILSIMHWPRTKHTNSSNSQNLPSVSREVNQLPSVIQTKKPENEKMSKFLFFRETAKRSCIDVRTVGDGDPYDKTGNHIGQLPYRVCYDFKSAPQKGNCVVWSFGIDGDWSFDDVMSEQGKCKVFAFDPTMPNTPEHIRNSGVHFYPIGLGVHNGTEPFGKIVIEVRSFHGILELLSREIYSPIIDVLKIDIEGNERKIFSTEEGLQFIKLRVRQLLIEWHGARNDTRTAYNNVMRIAGFESFYVEPRYMVKYGYLSVESLINPSLA